MKKYELTDGTIIYKGKTLHRIKRIADGQLGGFIEHEGNLSQDGTAWIGDKAKAYDNAKVFDNAMLLDEAEAYGNSNVYGNATLAGNSAIYGNARAFGWAWLKQDARLYGDAMAGHLVTLERGARVYEENVAYHGYVTKDLNLRENLIASILAQLDIQPSNGSVYCFKAVDKNLSSFHEPGFKYKIGVVECNEFDVSQKSCTSGLHVSSATYWDARGDEELLLCKVKLEDIITVQDGKIRCKKLEVIGVCDKNGN